MDWKCVRCCGILPRCGGRNQVLSWWVFLGLLVWNVAGIYAQEHTLANTTQANVTQPRTVNTSSASNSTETKDVGLFPVVFNLASNAKIWTNATCGENYPETYCRLVEHVKRRPTDKLQCGICDLNSPAEEERHPVENAIDGSDRWWQSPTITNGVQYHTVTITLDLKQVYQVAYVILKAANSPRPGNWILERSLDGETFLPWQYYALSDSACWTEYGVAPTIGVPRYKSDDEVICTSFYSRLNPLMNGEIHTSLINGRPGLDGPSEELLEFSSARFIRLRLQRIRTLNADLMTFMANDPSYLEPTVTNRYFYSIKDVSVGGQCICYGHAKFCPTHPETGELQCQCEQNTCGKNCEKCCPLYNQKPWRPGTYTESGMCEECNCFNHANECVFNQTVADHRLSLNLAGEYAGGGVCLDCQHNTMGMNCELCADGFYRPVDIDHTHPDACLPCDCHTLGSTGLCYKDDSLHHEGKCAGDCVCLPGFGGPKCDECALGFTDFPNCVPCPCSPAGSLNVDTCEGDCICKAHVCSPFCDECLPNFYNLQPSNPEGCDPCFCFGITSQCNSSTWGRKEVRSLEGWELTDPESSVYMVAFKTDGGHVRARTEDTYRIGQLIYWSAPSLFKGNKVLSYGGMLQFKFHYTVNESDSENSYLANHDVIMQGYGLRLGHLGQYYRENTDNIVKINMTEGEWRHLEGSTSETGTLVPREEFMMALARMEVLLLRASFHVFQMEMRLMDVTLETGSEDGGGRSMPSIEICECPEGYTGTSCELCLPGYRRVDDQLVGGRCVPCDCHNHGESCDPFTGECLVCDHHTQGGECAECMPGFFGDAVAGTPDDCTPCGCPLELASNSFAETCLVNHSSEGIEYVCMNCKKGHEGDFCEICSDGYYGNPQEPGNYCRPCECNGNIDLQAVGNCDRQTGECIHCLGHTEGVNCEICQDGYYGTAVNKDCKLCGCDPFGAVSSVCEKTTGQCHCKPLYTGIDCAQCVEGFGNVVVGCVPCNCSSLGSTSEECDSVSGQCHCRPGVGGLNCQSCLKGFYSFSIGGCLACGCDEAGAEGDECDSFTGQCTCKANIMGRTCDQCMHDHWGLDQGSGCLACDCDPVGSLHTDCEVITGQCRCDVGVTGLRCDQCASGYYGFSRGGCTECDACDVPGQVCDPLTGVCVCPPNTLGQFCENCMPDTWGHHPYDGCKVCNCSYLGSRSSQCELASGQCDCLEGYTGSHCDKCHFGHFGFPDCRPCHCSEDGTLSDKCDDHGHCQCDADGQCPCKENVGRKKCSMCRKGSFGIDPANPKGCTECFCFGRSDECEVAPMDWNKQSLPNQIVEFSTMSPELPRLGPDAHGLLSVPSGMAKAWVDPVFTQLPLYWSMPKSALGDKTLSYGGQLEFTVQYAVDDVGLSSVSTVPLVHLLGNFRLHLVHQHPIMGDASGRYQVILREDQWEEEDGTPATRQTLMLVLQNLQSFLIFAAPTASVTYAVLLDVGLDEAVPSTGATPTALGIEQCECPPEYSGLSCQNSGPGYYRHRPKDFLDSEDPIDLIGESKPCQCHGHSSTCDRETGVCQECEHHTTGKYCHLCASGFYGNATLGTAEDCKPCGCPGTQPEQNFSPTCRGNGDGTYVCTACRQGYTGPHCDSCADGFHGNPRSSGGNCSRCMCDELGSIGTSCDSQSGQCECRPGVVGRACDRCTGRYAMVDGICVSCDEGCSALLMTGVDDIEVLAQKFNSSAVALIPYKYLGLLETDTARLKEFLNKTDLSKFRELDDLRRQVEDQAKDLVSEVEDVKEEKEKEETEAGSTVEEAKNLPQDIEDLHKGVKESLNELLETVTHDLHNKTGGLDLPVALQDAEEALTDIGKVDFDEPSNSAEEELGNAAEVMDRMYELALRYTNTTDMKQRSENILGQLQELLVLSSHISNRTVHASDHNKDNKEKLYNVKLLVEEIESRLQDVQMMIGMTKDLNEDASHMLWNVSGGNYEMQEELREMLLDKTEELGTVEEDSESDTEAARPWLTRSQQHVRDLEAQAERLEEQFKEARVAAEDPVRASRAYQDMRDAILEADTAVMEASLAAENATLKAIPNEGDSLPDEARESRALSEELKRNASDLGTDLQEHLDKAKAKNQKIDDTNMVIGKCVMEINSNLDNLTLDVSRPVRAIKYRAATTIAKAVDIAMDAMDIQTAVDSELKPKIKELKGLKKEAIRKANNSINEARLQFGKLINLTATLDEKVAMIEQKRMEVDLDLKELKESIRLAREQANSIKLSMKSEGDCVRKYKPAVSPSTTNTIRMHFKVPDVSNNMLLLFVGNKDSDDYLTLELVGARVHFTWNVGAGAQTIEHGLTVEAAVEEAASDEQEKDLWYSITATRIANTGRLSVQRLSDVGMVDLFLTSGTSPSSHTQLHLDESADVFVGGIPQDYMIPETIVSRTFQGCVGEVFLDGKHIGLYNFREIDGDCQGCTVVPTIDPPIDVFQFDGTGYARMPPVKRFTSRKFGVNMQFRGYWKEALLFYTQDPVTGDFTSLELRGGHVVFRFSDAGVIKSLETQNKYNINEWVTVRATWSKTEGRSTLQVEREILDTYIQARQENDLNFQSSPLYFAGLPVTFNTTSINVTQLNFLGCVRSLEVVSRGTLGQNLLDGIFMGMTLGCQLDKSHVVGLEGDGHVELPSPDLPRDADLAFSFQTLQDDALLLLAIGTKPQSFYSVSLKGGLLNAWFNGGAGLAIVNSKQEYNDGKVHSVSLIKSNRIIDLYVDDQFLGMTRLPEGVSRISGMLGDQGGLYIGGVPEDIDARGTAASLQPLKGCISDIVINGRPLPIDLPVTYSGADIGRCAMDRIFPSLLPSGPSTGTAPSFTVTVTLPPVSTSSFTSSLTTRTTPSTTTSFTTPGTTVEPRFCARLGTFSYVDSAVSFGDIKHSHAEIVLRQKEANRDFNMTLEMRSFYDIGLLFYITNEADTEYVTVAISDEKIKVSYDDHGEIKAVTSQNSINDGLWHTISVTKGPKSIALVVDQEAASVGEVAKDIDVFAPMYVGGLPKVFDVREGLVSESFKGCLRHFNLNGRFIDLANSKSIMGVRQCFSDVEPGVHFDGYGYALYASEYEIISDFRASFTFRTVKRYGVIISTSEAFGKPALALELYEGKLKFTVHNDDGAFFVESNVCEFCLCDNRWHRVEVELIKNVVTMTIDGGETLVEVSPGSQTELWTFSELYLGGFPVYALPQGATTTGEFFEGCVKNFHINGTEIRWHQIERLVDVHVSDCPVTFT